MDWPNVVLLEGIVGSRAYGLDHADSDTDTLGIFAAPTEAFWKLTPVQETYVEKAPDPDKTYHEVGKACRLLLGCNPTLLELLWLPADLVTVKTSYSTMLRINRHRFLSTDRVRNAYGGYATQQIRRLQRRNEEGNPTFSSDTAKRTGKHARHVFRLLEQGRDLLTTGKMSVRVKDRAPYDYISTAPVDEIVWMFEQEIAQFDSVPTVLPDVPDTAWVERFLWRVRTGFLEG